MPHPVDVHVGRKVRECRIAQGLSQISLAKKLGISFQQVQKYESGANRIGGSRLWEISCILDVPVSNFFDGLNRTPARRGKRGGFSEPAAGYETDEALGRKTLELARSINHLHNGSIKREVLRLVRTIAESKVNEA